MKDKHNKPLAVGDPVVVKVLGKVVGISERGAKVSIDASTLNLESVDIEKIVTDENATEAGQE